MEMARGVKILKKAIDVEYSRSKLRPEANEGIGDFLSCYQKPPLFTKRSASNPMDTNNCGSQLVATSLLVASSIIYTGPVILCVPNTLGLFSTFAENIEFVSLPDVHI
jgi:hypothetical protein